MSAKKASNTETTTVYVELLDEGTFVMRPVAARLITERIFQLLPLSDYDPDLETWRFAPGSKVECAWEHRGNDYLLVAKRLAPQGAQEVPIP